MTTPEKVENEVLIGSYMISVLPPQKLKMKERASTRINNHGNSNTKHSKL